MNPQPVLPPVVSPVEQGVGVGLALQIQVLPHRCVDHLTDKQQLLQTNLKYSYIKFKDSTGLSYIMFAHNSVV